MKRDLRSLAGGGFDVLVMGGGIFGAGVARDAALRGLRVGLVEKSDFAGGTSSRSSKLIHGGFRYLEQGAFSLVRESCRERAILLKTAPHAVRDRSFLLPVYTGNSRPLWKMRAGMLLYDALAPVGSTPPHQVLSADRARMKEPGLAADGLRGAILYHDAQTDDARLCLDVLEHAADSGAVCANYCRVEGFAATSDEVQAARVRDVLRGDLFEVTARVFVNVTGPWVEQVAGWAPPGGAPVRLQPTKGSHFLVPRLTQDHAITFQGRQDGRIMFVLPWNDLSLVGTTDTDFDGDADAVGADPADVAYLLRELAWLFPGANRTESDVIATFAGVRALLRSDGRAPSARSRELAMVRQGRNLISVAGGKYTTYRAIAEDVVDGVCEVLGIKRRCVTATTMIPCRVSESAGIKLSECPPVYESDVRRACDEEMAVTLSDVMRRRTRLALSRQGSLETAAEVAKIMAHALGWTEETMREQFEAYGREWRVMKP